MIPQCLLSAVACCRVDVHCDALPLNFTMLQQQSYRADHVPAATTNLHTPFTLIILNVLRCGSPWLPLEALVSSMPEFNVVKHVCENCIQGGRRCEGGSLQGRGAVQETN